MNFQGAIVGGLVSGSLIAWISIGTQIKMAHGQITFPQKSVSVEGCNPNWVMEFLSFTLSADERAPSPEPPFILYRLSYMYYTVLGTIVAIVVGIIVSWLTGCNKNRIIHADLFSPVIQRFLKHFNHSKAVKSVVLDKVSDLKLKSIKQ